MISVIIPSYNSDRTIEKCLNALRNQSYSGDSEIILVDSSVDRTPDIVKVMFPEVKFFHLEKKTDPGTARNLGIKNSKGDIIVFIDSDCVAAPDWLDRIVTAHCSMEAGVIGGSVRPANDVHDAVGWAGYIAEFREFIPELPQREAEHIPTCNISYKRDIFERFGEFDGKYYPQEDLVFNNNLRKNGEKIIFVPDIQVKHFHRSRLNQFLCHQKKIGRITSKVLKTSSLEGAFLARIPLLSVLSIPLLPAVKFIRTLGVFLRYQPAAIVSSPESLFLFGLGLVYWETGFLQGVFNE